MFSPIALVAAMAGYAALLIGIAWRADNSRGSRRNPTVRALLYGLSLATISSSWTYFAAIGEARHGSWLYFASGLGPIVAVTLGFPLWRRIALLAEQENVGSIADFLAARYGKSRSLGRLVAIVATLGALPYIALQLIMLNKVWAFVTGTVPLRPMQTLLFMGVLMILAILFGTRRPSLTKHSRGMVTMVAVEACIKLLGLVGVAALCIWLAMTQPGTGSRLMAAVPPLSPSLKLPFASALLLSTLTAFTLPRQFHLGFVTLEKSSDIWAAKWLVPVYFGLWPLAVLIIGTAARANLGLPGVAGDLQVLAIPLGHDAPALTLLALLGGWSAGFAVIVVEATAVSAMVSNELVLPWLASRSWRDWSGKTAGQSVLRVRRATILVIGLLGWLYFLGVRQGIELSHLGFTALAAFAQLFPALVGAIYWPRGHARGAIAGIMAGTLLWGALIVAPTFLTEFDSAVESAAPPIWLLSGSWSFQVALFASLALNLCLYVLVSLRTQPRLIDTIQANIFVDPSWSRQPQDFESLGATVGDLRTLLTQFVGEQEAERALRDPQATGRVAPLDDTLPINSEMARAAERSLAGVVGAPSARNLVAIALAADRQDATEISRILDEAAHAVQFSRELLQTILDTLDQAVCVTDSELRLVAWNANYLRLLAVPLEGSYAGKHIDESFAGGAPQPDELTARRYLAQRREAVSNRTRIQDELMLASGRALRVIGTPLGVSDYMTTFVDITDLKVAERVLALSNEELEDRVHQRTTELTTTNLELASAKQLAERVTGAQRRFVAAASHDLVQPLHAARLFIARAKADIEETKTVTFLDRADHSVESAHRLLRALLNLSQLEVGVVGPKFEPVDAGLLLMSLFEEFTPQAEARGLELVILSTSTWVTSDPDLLRSMLQNLILNAIRYTPRGRVVVACRRSGTGARFEVRDSGVGIPEDALPTAFAEYRRLTDGESMSEGVGLGLSIVARISQVLDHPVSARSKPGKGSVFSITVPTVGSRSSAPLPQTGRVDLAGLRVLCVDDEPDVLASTKALIERWGACVTAAASAEEVDGISDSWDVVLADLRLGGDSGLELLKRLQGRAHLRVLITATPVEALKNFLVAEGIRLFSKPIEPAALKSVLASAKPPGLNST